MAITKSEVERILSEEPYGIFVTSGEKGMSSRTMSFGYASDDKLFFLTHLGTEKLSDIDFSKRGLFHVSSIKQNLTESYDISIEGNIELISFKNPLFLAGAEILAKKNPMVKDILINEESCEHYIMFIMHIQKCSAWNYIQILSGEPKTIIR